MVRVRAKIGRHGVQKARQLLAATAPPPVEVSGTDRVREIVQPDRQARSGEERQRGDEPPQEDRREWLEERSPLARG